MRLIVLLTTLGLSSMSFAAGVHKVTATKNSDIMPFEVTEKTLPNGLKVIVVPTGFPNIVSLQIPVQTGSRNEVEPGKTGFAHFFEHMMFRGTKTVSPEQYQSELSKMGAEQNAYTSGDYTNYHTTFAKENLETMLKLESDRFQNLDYSESAFKTEARAVLGEYNKNSANPGYKLAEVTQDKAFTTHTYKHTTMGFIKDIEDMPNQYAYSKVFFDRWYRPENTTIIVAGDVEATNVLSLVEKYWSGWKHGNFKSQIPVEPPAQAVVTAHVPWPSPTLPQVLVGFRGPGFSTVDRDYGALNLLLDISFGETSDIYKKLVIDEQKVSRLMIGNSDSQDPDIFSVYAVIKDPKDTVYVRDEIMKTLALATTKTVTTDRLSAVRSNARYSFSSAFDNTESIASILARFVRYERRFDTLNSYFTYVETITPEDIQKAAEKFITDKNLIITSLAHDPLPDAMGESPKLASFFPPSGNGSDIKTVVQKNSIPEEHIKLLFAVGSAHDPVGKEGLAALSAEMIADAGSALYKYDEIQKAAFPTAATFTSQVDKEMTTFTIRSNKDHLTKVLDLFIPSLLEPGFRTDDFERLKSDHLTSLKINLRNNNEEELAKERLQELVFAGTPYGHPTIGTIQSLEKITIEDVKSFVAKAYTTGSLIIGVNGQNADRVAADLKNRLGTLPSAAPLPQIKGLKGRMPDGLAVNIIEKNTRATAISFGLPIKVTRSHPDFVALWLARSWLGEHRSSMSHLYDRIREVRGLNYGDYAYIEAFPGGMYMFAPKPNRARTAQLFEVWIRPVVPENAHHALRIALYELDKLIKNGLTEAEFTKTRDFLQKNVVIKTATQDQQLGSALDSVWFGTDEYTNFMRTQLVKLKLSDVNRAIKRHFSAKNLQIVMITQDAQGLKKQLVADEESSVKYDGEKPKELLDEDKVIGNTKLKIAEDAVTISPVDSVFSGVGSAEQPTVW